MDELRADETIFASAVVLRGGFFVRLLLSLVAGSLAGALLYALTALAVEGCYVGGLAASIVAWLVLAKIVGSQPFVSVARVAITNLRIVALRPWSYEVSASHDIAEHKSHRYRDGFVAYGDVSKGFMWPSKMEIHFQDGDVWRMWGGMRPRELALLAESLSDLYSDR